jgi:hypothetical protein
MSGQIALKLALMLECLGKFSAVFCKKEQKFDSMDEVLKKKI